MEKTTNFNVVSNGKKQTCDPIPMKNWLNDTHFGTGHDIKCNSPQHDFCFTGIIIPRINMF